MKVLIKIQYLGTSYMGFQSQKNGNTIQEVLTDAAEKLFGMKCDITGCSRTDSGVHALGFCATIAPKGERFASSPMPIDKIPIALSHYLPDDISVIGACEVDDDFHARYNVIRKTYIYLMSDSKFRSPFDSGRVWQVKKPVNDEMLDIMNREAKDIIGKHDFTSFMATGSKIVDATRTVYSCSVSRTPDGKIKLEITADGFLYNMVRIIAGTLVDCAYGSLNMNVKDIIESKDRKNAGKTAPPCGLYLYDVVYEPHVEFLN